MQDKNKTQPKAFRITEETAEKFKEIAQSLGANQQQALAKLIEVYEMESGKESLPEMRTNIDTFEGYVRAATNMYLQSLEANQNMRAIVRTEFESLLKSKDTTITELQERVKKAETTAKNISEKENEYQHTIEKLNKENENLEKKIEDILAESNAKCKEQQEKYDALNTSYAKTQDTEKELQSMLSSFMKECEKYKSENDSLIEEKRINEEKLLEVAYKNESLIIELEKINKKTENETIRQKEIFEYQKAHSEMEYQLALQKQENELKDAHKKELDEMRKELDKYKDLYYQMLSSTKKTEEN